MKNEPISDPLDLIHLYETSHNLWLREFRKLLDNQPPYACDDESAMKRFENILNAGDKRQQIRIRNRASQSQE